MVHLLFIFPIFPLSGLSLVAVTSLLFDSAATTQSFIRIVSASHFVVIACFFFMFQDLFFLCSASLCPGSRAASRLDYFIFKTFFCSRTNKCVYTLQLSAVICSMGADLNLLTLGAQHWICLEMTKPQQFIPYSSYDSFWSFARANIRAASGTSSASPYATPTPKIFPLCS